MAPGRKSLCPRLDQTGADIVHAHSPPPIDVHSGEDLVVHAFNGIDQPMTLHHHGMFFNSTSWMDGAVGVSQW